MRRTLPLGSAAVAAALLLGGCGLLPSTPAVDPPATESPQRHADDRCARRLRGVRRTATARPRSRGCGSTDSPPRSSTPRARRRTAATPGRRTTATPSSTSPRTRCRSQQLDDFGAALEASGYQKLFDNFIPGTPSGESYYGARDYYLDGISDGDFTRLAIEIYPASDDDTLWTAYIDYLSPLTRQL